MTAIATLAAATAAIWFLRRRRRISAPDPRRELASVAMHLARATRQGMTPSEALAESAQRTQGPVGAQLEAACDRLGRGHSFDSALEWWADEASTGSSGSPEPEDVELLAMAARFAERQGSGLPEVFEGVTAALVDRSEVADEVGALTSQARASVVVLCALPVLGLILVASIEPTVPAALIGTPAGIACLAAALCLDVTAVWASSRLTRRAMR